LYKYLKRRGEDVMSKQVLRSGTSIGANVSEGLFAQSREDFASKNSIALKEARETYYWLDLLNDAGYLPKTDSAQTLLADCNELIAMLVSTVKTAKKT
jgi:four helix bundle protein